MNQAVIEIKMMFSKYLSVGDYVLYKKNVEKQTVDIVMFYEDYDYLEFNTLKEDEFISALQRLIEFEGKEVKGKFEIEDKEYAISELINSELQYS